MPKREYPTTIGLADWELKEDPATGYLIEQDGKVNFLIPGQDDDAWLYVLAKGGGYSVEHQPGDMLKILSGEAEPPEDKKDLFDRVKVTPVLMDRAQVAGLTVTAPTLLLAGPARYLMSLLTEKKKVDWKA